MVLLLREWEILTQPILNLSAYLERSRQEYYDHLLAVSQHGKWKEWLRFFLRGVTSQAQDSVFRMTQLQSIRTKNEALALAMPYMVAKRYVDKLVEAGVLSETTGYAHNRVFMAHEVFQALENSV